MKEVKYEIYQTKSRDLRFLSTEEIKHFSELDVINELDISNEKYQYECVYENYIDVPKNYSDINILEDLYRMFNIHRPTDYRSRSLSMSDVLVIDDRKYYVDDIGYKLLKV